MNDKENYEIIRVQMSVLGLKKIQSPKNAKDFMENDKLEDQIQELRIKAHKLYKKINKWNY